MNSAMDTKIQLDALYQEIILDHHKDPRNFGPLDSAEAKAEGFNPVCGDRVEVEIKTDPKNKSCLLETKFTGEGCSICMASASMMSEDVEGKKIEAIKMRIESFRNLMKGESLQDFKDTDLEALTGVCKFPVRIKCALLPWTTLKEAVEKVEP